MSRDNDFRVNDMLRDVEEQNIYDNELPFQECRCQGDVCFPPLLTRTGRSSGCVGASQLTFITKDLHPGYSEVSMIRSYDHFITPPQCMDCGLCNVGPVTDFELKGDW